MVSRLDDFLIKLREVSLSYGNVRALNKVSLDILPGEIHAVVGEHGAGKSSLGLIISGMVEHNSGNLTIGGRRYQNYNNRRALAEGIIMVRQEPNLFRHRTVLDNIYVSRTSFNRGLIGGKRKRRRQIEAFLRSHGVDLNLDSAVRDLNLSDQVLLEIMRGLFISPRLLILDESLEKLTSSDLTIVNGLLKDHVASGSSVLFITHRIDDIFRLADRVSVVKKGEIMLTESIESMDKFSLIKMAYTQYPLAKADADPLDSEFYHLLKYNQAILENLPVNLLAVNNEGIVKLINEHAADFFRRDRRSIRGMAVREFLDGEDDLLTAISELLDKNEMTTLYHRVLSANYQNRVVNVTVLPIRDETWPIGSLLMIDDVTEQERLRENVHLNDKLESIGLLAAGVAHEINNPMEIILNNVEYLESVYRDRIDTGILREISEEINAVSDIVGTLSIIGDQNKSVEDIIDAESTVISLVNLLNNYANEKGIRLEVKTDTNPKLVRAHHGEIRQIILNLLKNSMEAMENGGRIDIETTTRNGVVAISVSDNGPGIDPDKRKDIFLPFFTTKKGDATKRGLGLYMVYQLVEKNRGHIGLDTDYREGCRINLEFPASSS